MTDEQSGMARAEAVAPAKLPDPQWVRKEREAAFGLLAGPDGFSIPGQGSVSRDFADGRYREVTARISATTKDMEAVIAHHGQASLNNHTVVTALGWTFAAVVVVILGIVLGELAGAAGSAILDGMNE